MKHLKPISIISGILLVTSLVGFSLLGCASDSDQAKASEAKIASVQRGNLSVDITASGNLALSRTEDLAFDIAGTVEEVFVEEGDSVEEGQVLAKLDTSAWEDILTALKRQLTTAKRQLTAKERQVTTKELALRQAQINLQTAEYNLTSIEEVKEAQDDVDDAEFNLKVAQTLWEQAIKFNASEAEINFYIGQITQAKTALAAAQKELTEVLTDTGVRLSTDVVIAVASKLLAVEQAQRAVEDAQIAIEDAQMDVEDARIDAEDAQKALDEALNTGPEIKAPFTGFVTKVNVKGGDEVQKGTVAVVVADPNKFEAEITVSETDIFQVKLGGNASVQVDAMQGISLPAKVTHISPTATIQSGVVNYKVKVEVQSLEAVAQESQAASQGAMQDIQQGELPERLKQAIEAGRITQEQAEEMMKQQQQAQGEQQAPTIMSENFQLKQGLTVTVSIIIQEKNNVLLVPNSAITTQGRQAYVKVVSPDGTVEERVIQTGISDYTYTEVTQGLSEGEKVLVPQATTTTTTTTQQRPPGGMFIPGMGGPPR